MNLVLKIILILVSSISLLNYSYAFDDKKSQDNQSKEQEEVNLSKNSSPPLTDNKDSNDKNNPENDEVNKTVEPPKRSFKIEETFILTDKTKANTFRISTEKKWSNFKDKLMISYDIFGQEDQAGKFQTKRNRIELNYKLYISNLSEKQPFIEYFFSTDQPTRLNWKVLSGGIGKKLPFDLKVDVGYGYKWGKITEKETYKYDVVTINLNNKKKISNFTLDQNFKTITPRSLEHNKQPIYDYKSSLSTPITKNLNGTIKFDWRYQKIPELKKDDWFNYTIKFGLTFIPRK